MSEGLNIIVSEQAKDTQQREAIDKLRFQVEEQQKDCAQKGEHSFETLQSMGLEDLAELAKAHTRGQNITGWKNPYPLDNPKSVMLEYGVRYADDDSRFKDALWPRQSGKDFNSEEEVSEDSHKRDSNHWMVAAPSERQSLDSLEQCKTWCEAWALRIDDYNETREGSSGETLLKSAEIKLSNKSKVTAVPGRPETVRGKSTNVLLTEADFFEKPKETIRAILPSISNPMRGGEKKMRVVSTPNGVEKYMHQLRTMQTTKMKWSHHTMNIYQAVLMGLPVDFEALIEAFGDDHDGVRQELFCEFLDSSNVLLPYDLIQQSESMEATEVWDPAMSLHLTGPTFTGIDFGRIGDPTVAWTLQLVGNCLWTREVLVLKNVSTPNQERILRERVAGSVRTAMDYTGPGIGLGDMLVEKHSEWDPDHHKFGKVELCKFTREFKCELFPALRRSFQASMPDANLKDQGLPIRIPVSRVIREDLHQMVQTQSGDQYNYWSPRTRNGHSDRCTALALAVRAAGAPIASFGFSKPNRPARGRRTAAL